MRIHDFDAAKVQRFTLGNPGATDFLAHHWSPYVHEIDDIVDGERTSAEDVLATFARAICVFSHPFYLQHLNTLKPVAFVVHHLYADSVAFERAPEAWKQQWADHARHCGMEMALAVAQICGGYDHARALSLEQRTICYLDHHDREGKVV